MQESLSDILVRRNWGVQSRGGKWFVVAGNHTQMATPSELICCGEAWADTPDLAVRNADNWLKGQGR